MNLNLLRTKRNKKLNFPREGGGGVGTPYNSLYWETPPKRGTLIRVQVYERAGILFVEVYERPG